MVSLVEGIVAMWSRVDKSIAMKYPTDLIKVGI
jgi:hypothetical protein